MASLIILHVPEQGFDFIGLGGLLSSNDGQAEVDEI
jgi:hypothetical protein